jgi:hypothetical protein
MYSKSMKICSKCKIEKTTDLFMKRAKSSDGLGVWCKPCLKVYEQERIAQDKDAFYTRKITNRDKILLRNQALLIEYFSTHPCIDCGNTDFRVLQFDHRDAALKQFNIADKLANSWEFIYAEILKCDVRCANCHTIRTSIQFGTWRSKITKETSCLNM